MDRELQRLIGGPGFRKVDPVHSRLMRSIRARNTKPELLVRSVLHRLGYRFRLHRGDLPGRPDLVLPRHGKVIDVRGCFWHMHNCRLGNKSPRRNAAYWQRKRERNCERDERNHAELEQLGWHVLVVWECETKDLGKLLEKLRNFLSS